MTFDYSLPLQIFKPSYDPENHAHHSNNTKKIEGEKRNLTRFEA